MPGFSVIFFFIYMIVIVYKSLSYMYIVMKKQDEKKNGSLFKYPEYVGEFLISPSANYVSFHPILCHFLGGIKKIGLISLFLFSKRLIQC